MHMRILAAALLAPVIAFAPASAWAHHCSKYRHHHARNAETGAYGTSKSMNKGGRTGTDNMNKGSGAGAGGSTDQGATSGGSTSSGTKSGGGI